MLTEYTFSPPVMIMSFNRSVSWMSPSSPGAGRRSPTRAPVARYDGDRRIRDRRLLTAGENARDGSLLTAEEAAMSRSEIDALNATFVQGLEQRDAGKIASLYAPDAQLLPPGSPPLTGAAIEQFWQNFMDSGIDGGVLKSLSVEEHGDRAIEVGHYEAHAGGQVVATGNYVVVHHRQSDGTWKLGIDIFNSDQPAPEA